MNLQSLSDHQNLELERQKYFRNSNICSKSKETECKEYNIRSLYFNNTEMVFCQNNQSDVNEKELKRLEEKNNLLRNKIQILEKNLLKLEEEGHNHHSEEKASIQIILSKSEEEKRNELNSLNKKFSKLVVEMGDLRLKSKRYKNDIEKLKAEKHLLTENLEEIDRKLTILQRNFENIRKESKWDIEILKRERDEYEKIIAELYCKKYNCSTDILNLDNSKYVIHHEELENLVCKLKNENKKLSKQLEDTSNDVSQRVTQSQDELLKMKGILQKELEHFSKEELMEIILKEKNVNLQMKAFIEKVIVKVIERTPSLLENLGASKFGE